MGNILCFKWINWNSSWKWLEGSKNVSEGGSLKDSGSFRELLTTISSAITSKSCNRTWNMGSYESSPIRGSYMRKSDIFTSWFPFSKWNLLSNEIRAVTYCVKIWKICIFGLWSLDNKNIICELSNLYNRRQDLL